MTQPVGHCGRGQGELPGNALDVVPVREQPKNFAFAFGQVAQLLTGQIAVSRITAGEDRAARSMKSTKASE